MKHLTLAAIAVVALFLLLTVGAPRASADTFNFTSCHFSSGCPIPGTSFGTVTLTQSGANVNFDIVLASENRFVETGAGGGDLFVFNDTNSSTVITNITVTLNGSDVTSTFTGGIVGATDQSPFQADGTGMFTAGVACATSSQCNGGSTPDINDLHFTVTNTTVAALETTNANGNIFVADILCGSCTGGPTGPVDVSTPTVPDGGMTLMLLGGALVGVESLRRRIRA